MLASKDLQELNSKGFIVGPNENQEDFLKRVRLLKNRDNLKNSINMSFTFLERTLSKQYDFDVDWLVCSKKRGNSFLHAAETDIFLIDKVAFPVIRLPKSFTSKPFFENVVIHEIIHALRAPFDAPKYEEFIAYSCSKSNFYKKFGPMFCSRFDSLFFLVLSFLPLFVSFFIKGAFWGSFLLPVIFTTFLLIRLLTRIKTFNRCLKHLKDLFPLKVNPLSIVVRLTDEEIEFFSKSNPVKSKYFILQQTSLRWRQILSSYPFKIL